MKKNNLTVSKKKKSPEKLSEDSLRVGDIIMLNAITSSIAMHVVAYGRIRKIRKKTLLIKLIPIPSRINLLKKFYTASISNPGSKTIKKYWIVEKKYAVLLIKSNQASAKYNYKSLSTFVKIRYASLIDKRLLKL